MALTRIKTWTAELLTSAELNAEFNNILNNPVSLISPLTAAVDMNGFELILDADADTSIISDTDDRIDFRIGGADGVFIGLATGNTGAFAHIDPGAFTATAATDIGLLRIGNTNAVTVPAGVTAVAAGLYVEIPNWTATGTITESATLYIEGAATEGDTADYAVWVDAGDVRIDGDLLTGSTTFNLVNATATTVNFAGAATTLNVGLAAGSTTTIHGATAVLGEATGTTTIKGTTVAIGADTGTTTFAGSTIPQNSQSVAYELVAADANKHILHPTADNTARTFTLPANTAIAFPVGTVITFVNQINVLTIAITDDTLTLAGANTTGSVTIAAGGMATALKVTTTIWFISGAGIAAV